MKVSKFLPALDKLNIGKFWKCTNKLSSQS